MLGKGSLIFIAILMRSKKSEKTKREEGNYRSNKSIKKSQKDTIKRK